MSRMSFPTVLVMTVIFITGGIVVSPERAAAEVRPFKARMAGNAMLTPTDDPCVLRNNATAVGNSTHTGLFSWTTEEVVNFCTVPDGVEVAGSFTMVVASSDHIYGQFAAVGHFDETGGLVIDGTYEIVGGTGRFTEATGSGNTDVIAFFSMGLPFTAVLNGTIDY